MKEFEARTIPGALALTLYFVLLGLSGYLIYHGATDQAWMIAAGIVLFFLLMCVLGGFFVVQPNDSRVMILFGSYHGTVKRSGFHYSNPFMSKRAVSLRARTLNGEKLKVNDLQGNPIEIAAIVVWQVEDTVRAILEVDAYEQYVALQSETALRHTASIFPYDAEDGTHSLRGNTEEIGHHLESELRERLQRAGVKVIEARLSHLAYAPEIASAMLRRQQASAVIAARQRIVDGAVGMVEMAIERMDREGVVKLDDERKATMISNLMVVLCSEHSVQPVVNAGSLYN